MPIIPGQSLTAEPKNAPYENPPEMVDPEDAIMWHLDRLSEPDRIEALIDSLELGLDVVTLTEGLLRNAVMEGRHNIDVSLIIGPVVHEFIKTTADKAGADYEEGLPDDSKEKAKTKYQINSRKARKILDEMDSSGKAPSPKVAIPEEVAEVEAPKGLMSRKTKEVL